MDGQRQITGSAERAAAGVDTATPRPEPVYTPDTRATISGGGLDADEARRVVAGQAVFERLVGHATPDETTGLTSLRPDSVRVIWDKYTRGDVSAAKLSAAVAVIDRWSAEPDCAGRVAAALEKGGVAGILAEARGADRTILADSGPVTPAGAPGTSPPPDSTPPEDVRTASPGDGLGAGVTRLLQGGAPLSHDAVTALVRRADGTEGVSVSLRNGEIADVFTDGKVFVTKTGGLAPGGYEMRAIDVPVDEAHLAELREVLGTGGGAPPSDGGAW